jgi:GWxTD domain-containing protein
MRIRDFFGEEIFQSYAGLEPLGVVNSFIVYPSRLVESDSVRLMFTIVSDENRRLDSLRVRLDTDAARFSSRAIPRAVARYSDSLRLYLGPIASGDYVVCLDVYAQGSVVETRKTGLMLRRSFFVEDRLYLEKVRQLRYIATEEEMGRLKKLPAAEREQGWNEFWKKQDENPNTDVNETKESYFARIDYAQEHFAHADRGWESDRGMIYVKYGPPDDIEYHSFELHSEDYEIWYYYRLNRMYTFVDTHGQGRFVLTTKEGKRI